MNMSNAFYRGWMLAATLLLASALHAQVPDSLRLQALEANPDSVRANAYRKMAYLLADSKTDSALIYAARAYHIAMAGPSAYMKAVCAQALGVAYDYAGKLDSAGYYLREGVAHAGEGGRIDAQSHIMSDLAIAYYYRGIYELALRAHLQALTWRLEFGDSSFISKSLHNTGMLYKAKKDYGQATHYYWQSLQMKQALHDSAGIFNTLLNLGSLYQSRQMFDSASVYAMQALDVAKKLGSEADEASATCNAGMALLGLGKMDEAKQMLQLALTDARQHQHSDILITCLEGLGDLALQEQNVIHALAYYSEGMNVAHTRQRREALQVFYTRMASANEAAGKPAIAVDYLHKSIALKDSLLNEENLRQINEMSEVYAAAQKEQTIQDLSGSLQLSQLETRLNRKQRNFFIASSIAFLALIAALWVLLRRNRKQRSLLQQQHMQIAQQLQENTLLMREIHHRVKNNLQVVSSLLSLQTHYLSDPGALGAVVESRNRVQSMALIHKNLYQGTTLTSIPVAEYMGNLCENLFQSYNIHPDKIKLQLAIAPQQMDVDTMVPIGLMVNELITNALKYAFPEGRKGIIRVGLQEQGDGWKLSVYDNGIGFPEAMLQPEHRNSSFGTRLIQSFVQKLEGEWHRSNEDGARVDIVFKEQKKDRV